MPPRRWCVAIIAILMLLGPASLAATPTASAVDPPTEASEIVASAELLLEVAVLTAQPASMHVGQSVGAAAGVHSAGWLSFGVVSSLSQAAESSLGFAVEHLEWRARVMATAVWRRGRGNWLLRAGLGGTLISENSLRHQSARLTGDTEGTTTWALMPAAEVTAGVQLRVFESWGVGVAAGPAWHMSVAESSLKAGFTATVGVLRWL